MPPIEQSSAQPHADPDTASGPVVGACEIWREGTLETHAHQRHQLMYSHKGSIHVVTEAGSWMLPPTRAIWIRGGTAHSFQARRSVELQVIYIDPAIMPAVDWEDCVVVNVTPLVRELVSATVALPWDYRLDSAAGRLAGVLLDQLVVMPHAPMNLPEPSDPRAKRVTALLRADPSRRSTLIELAAVAAVSARTLERLFHVEAGMSFNDWRQRLRLVTALEMLADGASVNWVADAIGYDNPSSFINAFRKLFGVTPGGYFK